MRYWLLKSEPEEYSYADLAADGVAAWDGVTGAPAQAQMRQMAPGDRCVIYHTGTERAAVGLATVERGPYPDRSDPRGRRVLVDVRAAGALARPVPLAVLKMNPKFAESPLVRNSRLSVVPLSAAQYQEIVRLGGRS